MFQSERHQKIIELIKTDGAVRLRDLRDIFGISDDSIRKDLDILEQKGLLERTYGGAVAKKDVLPMMEAAQNRSRNINAKRLIAQAAIKLIDEKDMVFLDVSTCNLAIAELLAKTERELTVATNMIDILSVVAKNPHIRVIFAGGIINKRRDGFWGPMTIEFISRLKPDVAFVGTVGVDMKKNSVATYDVEDGLCKSAIVKLSKRAYVVAEAKKLSDAGNYNYATFDALTGLVTDSEPPVAIKKAAAAVGAEIILP